MAGTVGAPMVCPARRLALALPLIGLAMLAMVPPAGAQTADGPLVVARSFEPIPHGWAFEVEPRDDADANLRLRDMLIEELRARSLVATVGAPLRLRFTTDRVTTTASDRGASLGRDGSSPSIGD